MGNLGPRPTVPPRPKEDPRKLEEGPEGTSDPNDDPTEVHVPPNVKGPD